MAGLSQLTQGASVLNGTVRDQGGSVVAGATVELQSQDLAATLTALTDAEGKYRFLVPRSGVYQLRAIKGGFEEARIPPIFFREKEEKTVDLTLAVAKTASSSVSQPQFFDEPEFTVAGVQDTTNLGGHGSDIVIRTREGLAKETMSLGKGSARLTTDKTDVDEQSLREAAQREPADFNSNHRCGHVLLEHQKAQESITYLERADKLKPNDFENLYDLALANEEAGKYDRALEVGKGLLALHDAADVHHLLGEIDEKRGDSLAAVREYELAAKLDPKEVYFFDWGSELLLHLAPEPALEVFRKGNHLFPNSQRMLVGLGAAWFARGSYDEASRRICEASDLDPQDPAPYLFLGRIERAEPNITTEALEKLQRFVTLHSNNVDANYFYAVALWKFRKQAVDEATVQKVESLLNAAIRFDPNYSDAYLQLGIMFGEEKNFPKAIENLEKAVRIDPKMEEGHYRLAQAYRQAGDEKKANAEVQLYQQARMESAQRIEQERHEIRQFVYTLRDQPQPAAR